MLNWEGTCVECPVHAPAQAGSPTPDSPGLCTTRVQKSSMRESPQPLWTLHGKVRVVLFFLYSF